MALTNTKKPPICCRLITILQEKIIIFLPDPHLVVLGTSGA
jgi:hypothetical protein